MWLTSHVALLRVFISKRISTDYIEDPFVELEGVARIREALHAHVWPILKMKVNPPPPSEAHSVASSADNDTTAEEPSVQQIVGWYVIHPSCVAFSFGVWQ